MLKSQNHNEDVRVINTYVPNNIASTFIKEEMIGRCQFTIIKDFKIKFLSGQDRWKYPVLKC